MDPFTDLDQRMVSSSFLSRRDCDRSNGSDSDPPVCVEFDQEDPSPSQRLIFDRPSRSGKTIQLLEAEFSQGLLSHLDFNYKIIFQGRHVWRKESDFIQLRKQLLCHPDLLGFVIPSIRPMPALQRLIVSKLTINSRMDELEAFLARLVLKLPIREAKLFKAFLQSCKLPRPAQSAFLGAVGHSRNISLHKAVTLAHFYYNSWTKDDKKLPARLGELQQSLEQVGRVSRTGQTFTKNAGRIGTRIGLQDERFEELAKLNRQFDEVQSHTEEGLEVILACEELQSKRQFASLEISRSRNLSQKEKSIRDEMSAADLMLMAAKRAESELEWLLKDLQRRLEIAWNQLSSLLGGIK